MWKRCHLSSPDPFLHNQWEATGKEISSQESRVWLWRQAGRRRVPCAQGRRNSWRHRSGPHITLQTGPTANSPYILGHKGKVGCHTESTVHLLRASDAPGNFFSICWSFWAWGKNRFLSSAVLTSLPLCNCRRTVASCSSLPSRFTHSSIFCCSQNKKGS